MSVPVAYRLPVAVTDGYDANLFREQAELARAKTIAEHGLTEATPVVVEEPAAHPETGVMVAYAWFTARGPGED